MEIIILLPILLLLSGWAATAISRVVRKGLVKAGNSYAEFFQVLTWVGCFILIASATIFLVVNNIRFER